MTAALLPQLEVAAIRRLCPVLAPLTVTEWADAYRILPESSTAPGPYRSSVVPYARRWQDMLADPGTETVVLCWGSQLGKSTIIENAIGYRIARQPTPIVLVRPKIEDAEGWMKERFVPMVRVTPALAERVMLRRSTSAEETSATLRFKTFSGGFLFVASATSATELASRSAPFMALDEIDRMEPIKGEGNPVEIAMRRMGAADIATAVLTSTPKEAESTLIWPYLEGGTYELYHVPCPHCHHRQALVWGGPNEPRGLKWDAGKPETAAYLCESCGTLVEERHKARMLAEASECENQGWVVTNPEGTYPSSHLNTLYSPFAKSSWRVLAHSWIKAQGKPNDLQVFINTYLAEVSKTGAQKFEVSVVSERREPMEEGVIPEGVGVLTLAMDLQESPHRIEGYVWGWGAGLESWLIASFTHFGDPKREPSLADSVWNAAAQEVTRTYRHVNGRQVPIAVTFVDSGYAAPQVYRFCRPRLHLRVFPCKGVGGPHVPLLNKPTMQGQGGEKVPLYSVGVDRAKNEFLRSQIGEQVPGAGFVHFPAWLTEEQCQQFVNEQRKRKINKGTVVYEWHRVTEDAPNEALDCRVYARAGLEVLGMKFIAQLAEHAKALALPVAEQPEQPTRTASAPRQAWVSPPRSGRNWVTGS